jgi:dihydrofolate reductase
MTITIIAAMADNRVIGKGNATPWHIPADLARFKELTLGHTIIMGHKTFASIGHPLPGRKIIILSRQRNLKIEGCLVVENMQAALDLSRETEELFICGGGEIYRLALNLADRIFLTVVHGNFSGDTYFPELPPEFKEVFREEVPDNHHPCTFIEYRKVAH